MKNVNFKVDSGVVKLMRAIREQISKEIQDMTFEEERAFLDKLLAEGANTEKEISR